MCVHYINEITKDLYCIEPVGMLLVPTRVIVQHNFICIRFHYNILSQIVQICIFRLSRCFFSFQQIFCRQIACFGVKISQVHAYGLQVAIKQIVVDMRSIDVFCVRFVTFIVCRNVIHVSVRRNVHRSLGLQNCFWYTCDCHDNVL